MTITTGSGLQRFVECRWSSVGPRSFDETSSDASRGRAVHAYLQNVAESTPAGPEADADREVRIAALLDQVDVEHRGAAEAVDLTQIADCLALSAEVTFAYKPSDGTSRILGSNLNRAYDAAGVRDDEVPGTLDVVGDDAEHDVVKVVDYKGGWAALPPTRRNWQLRGGSIAAARALDRGEADAQIIYLRDGNLIRRDRHRFDPLGLAEIEHQLGRAWERTQRDRDAFARGELVPATVGSWCKYCPSFNYCPANNALIQMALNPTTYDGPTGRWRSAPLSVDDAVQVHHLIAKVKPIIKALESAVYRVAESRTLELEVMPNGDRVLFGEHLSIGNRKLDAVTVLGAIVEVLLPPPPHEDDTEAVLAWSKQHEELRDEVVVMSTTQEMLEAAIKMRVARGLGASTMRKVIAIAESRGGVTRKTGRKVGVFTLPAPTPLQQGKTLPAGKAPRKP